MPKEACREMFGYLGSQTPVEVPWRASEGVYGAYYEPVWNVRRIVGRTILNSTPTKAKADPQGAWGGAFDDAGGADRGIDLSIGEVFAA